MAETVPGLDLTGSKRQETRWEKWSEHSFLGYVLVHVAESKAGAIGGGFVLLLALVALFAPHLSPYDPIQISPQEALQPPSLQHLAGTDRFGRDILTRIMFGARISLQVGFIGVAIAGSAGGVMGLIAGYYRGRIDDVTVLFINILLALPGILLALVIVAVLGPGLQNVMIAVGISAIPGYARVVRGSTLSVKENLYVEGARAIGCSDRRIMFRYILPNVFAPVIVLSTLGVATAILVGAAVSFLGLGAKPPTPEWGVMVSEGRNYLRQAWWLSTMPGVAIMVTAIALNLLGDSLRDALDPQLRT